MVCLRRKINKEKGDWMKKIEYVSSREFTCEKCVHYRGRDVERVKLCVRETSLK